MKKNSFIVVSQRIEYFKKNREFRDCLDQRLIKWLAGKNYISIPLPNNLIKFKKHHCDYKAIKKCRNVRLINPSENTYELMKHAEGIITLGSTVGYEAFLMKKPVIIVGEPWYRNFPGVHAARTPEVLAELLQNIDVLKVASDDEILKVIYSLYELSFEGVRYPHPKTLHSDNISNFTFAFKERIESAINSRFNVGR